MRCKPSGPLDAKIMLIGEAPGGEEERLGIPFVGESGKELTKLLKEAGIDREECYLTNVFMDRPKGNKFHYEWCRGKKEVSEEYLLIRDDLKNFHPLFDWPTKYTWSSVAQGKYVMPVHLGELQRLREEIIRVKPNLVVALGGTPLWALLGTSGITKLRGAVAESTLVPGQKVLPAFHPAYIQRAWDDRLTLVADLIKAKNQMLFPEIRRPERIIWIHPTHSDMEEFYEKYIKDCPLLSFDTETKKDQITCISFAPTPSLAIVIPFVNRNPDPKKGEDYNYWKNPADEVRAWRFVQKVLDSPMPKLAQNGLYDLQYLWTTHGISVRNFAEDTMLLHHSIYIELPKDLGFLGSIYTEEVAWKLMRTRAKDSVEKKDD